MSGNIAVRGGCSGYRHLLSLFLLLACSYILKPDIKGNVVFEVFRADSAIFREELAQMHVYGVDVLKVVAVTDLGSVLARVVRCGCCKDHVIVVVVAEIICG